MALCSGLAFTWNFKHDVEQKLLHDGPETARPRPLLDGQPGDGLQRLTGELQLDLHSGASSSVRRGKTGIAEILLFTTKIRCLLFTVHINLKNIIKQAHSLKQNRLKTEQIHFQQYFL